MVHCLFNAIHRIPIYLSFLTVLFVQGTVRSDQNDFFESKVRPILIEKCERCHSGKSATTYGGLALDSALGWKNGSDSGEVIIPFHPSQSLLIRAVEYQDDSLQMPPPEDGGKLTDAEISILKHWIEQGAIDPRSEESKRGGLTESEIYNWWSFMPPESHLADHSTSSHSSDLTSRIDAEVSRQLSEHKIAPMPMADRRTLLRRATYDLTGLPPAFNEVRAFEQDPSPDAWEKVVDRLLSSPQYGERWGRHWLDVVRYADTAGDNTDHPVQDLWRYRNWVLNSFNSNMPYDQFVREQLAGDLIHESSPPELKEQGIIATGFLALARRFDHDIDTTTHLMLEDAIDVVGKAFQGLTIACARCHDHKYDPITAADYYALYGILSSSKFSFPGCEAKQLPRDLLPLQSDERWTQLTKSIQDKILPLEVELADLSQKTHSISREGATVTTLLDAELAEGTDAQLATSNPLNTRVQQGDLLVLEIDPQGNYGADTTRVDWTIHSPANSKSWDLASDLLRSRISQNPTMGSSDNLATWLLLDGRSPRRLLTEFVERLSGVEGLSGWRSDDNPAVFMNISEYTIKAWTDLPASKVFVHPAPDGAVAIGWLSPIDGEVEIRGSVADQHPGGPNGIRFKLLHYRGDHRESIENYARNLPAHRQLSLELAELKSSLPNRPTAYGVSEGQIADAPVQLRGDPEKKGHAIPRRWIERLGGEKLTRPERSGRDELANWIVHPSNPLTARVMANRIWHYHFGKGLVSTPNDFGTRGEKPTHPALLDELAIHFKQSNWDIKRMHRWIMNSQVYRRASFDADEQIVQQGLEHDPKNKLLWRFDRRRLSAEELRDTLLLLSSRLDLTPGSEHPIPPPSGWGYTQHIPFSFVFPTNRRTVYQLTLRNRRDAYMGLFDGADPNSSTATRQSTTIPTQSLYFLNAPLFHEYANATLTSVYEKLVEDSLPKDSATNVEFRIQVDTHPSLINELVRTIWLRDVTPTEQDAMKNFLTNYPGSQDGSKLHAWQALTRIMLAANEFLYID